MIFLYAPDRHGFATRQRDTRAIRDISRLGNQDLVSGINDGPDRNVEGFRNTAGDDNLLVAAIVQIIVLRKVAGECIPQQIGRASCRERVLMPV